MSVQLKSDSERSSMTLAKRAAQVSSAELRIRRELPILTLSCANWHMALEWRTLIQLFEAT